MPSSAPPRPVDLVVDCLAAFRAARLIAEDHITAPLRDQPFVHRHPQLRTLVNCEHCTAVYAALALSLLRTAQARNRPVNPTHSQRAAATLRSTAGTLRYALAVAGAVSVFRDVLDTPRPLPR